MDWLEAGLSYSGACGQLGKPVSTVRDFQAADPAFSARVARARARVEAEYLTALRDSETSEDIKKWTWLLERSFPHEYSEKGVLKAILESQEALIQRIAELTTRLSEVAGAKADAIH